MNNQGPSITTISLFIFAFLCIGGAYWYFGNSVSIMPNIPPSEDERVESKQYSSEALGITFSYPDGYFVEEKKITESTPSYDSVILTLDTEENRAVREGLPGAPLEGPTAITVDVFPRVNGETANAWVERVTLSNFGLGTREVQEVMIGNTSGISYQWSGLYAGKSIAVPFGDRIYMLSVTFLTPEDQIVSDFDALIRSFTFTK